MRRFILFLALALQCFGANHYIRTGASGSNNGSDWTNAYPSFASSISAGLVRGDTYYVAGGTYSESMYINVAKSGTLWIYFKKATVSDHGTGTGWNDAYGTAVATITAASAGAGVLDLDKGYISFDGTVGSATSGHGFHVINTSSAEGSKVIQLENGAGPFSLSHTNMEGSGFASGANGTQGIYYTNFTDIKGVYIGYCWIHEVTINGMIATQLVGTSYNDYGFLFENNVVSETGGCSDPDKHGQGMQLGQQTEFAYIIIRNNVFRNIVGSGMIVGLTSGDGANHHDWLIYNNVFYITDPETYQIISPGTIWHEPQGVHSGTVINNFKIYNNTFYNITGVHGLNQNLGRIALDSTGITTTGNESSNNVWEGCRWNGAGYGINTESNNGYYGNNSPNGTIPSGTTNQVNGSSSTFVDSAAYDFALKAGGYALAAGLNLTATFTTYADGTARADAAFDLGTLPLGEGSGGSVLSGSITLSGSIVIH